VQFSVAQAVNRDRDRDRSQFSAESMTYDENIRKTRRENEAFTRITKKRSNTASYTTELRPASSRYLFPGAVQEKMSQQENTDRRAYHYTRVPN